MKPSQGTSIFFLCMPISPSELPLSMISSVQVFLPDWECAFQEDRDDVLLISVSLTLNTRPGSAEAQWLFEE